MQVQGPSQLTIHHSSVVTSSNFFGPKLFGHCQKSFELNFLIADHVRVWSSARRVLTQKILHHPLTVLSFKINRTKGDSQGAANRPRISLILLPTTFAQ